MRITARQLRLIIKEELTRSIREADETAQGAVEMPSAPTSTSARRAYRDYIRMKGGSDTADRKEQKLRAAANVETWNEAWGALSDGERAVYVALVKGGPDVGEVAGDAIRRKQFKDYNFAKILDAYYPSDAGMFASVAGKDVLGGLSSKMSDFYGPADKYRLERRLRELRMYAMAAPSSPIGMLASLYPNLVALIEMRTGESIEDDGDKLLPPESGPIADLLFRAGMVSGRVVEP